VSAVRFPETGIRRDDLLAALDDLKAKDADWRGGRTFSLVYFAGDDVLAVIREAYGKFLATNALSPMAFPSLRRLETEVVAMTADLLHAPEPAGFMTSGGSESILMALKTARDKARAERPDAFDAAAGGGPPEMVLPVTAHPAFEKAAHYLGLRAVHVPLRDDFRADVAAARAAITDRTVLVVGSAPGYPQGVIDPIPELAAAAAERGVGCHVDACLGGFFLPFAERLGRTVPPFDFRVPGVTSMSADLHKYGYSARGASVVLYRDRDLRRHQMYVYADWPGGLYGSPTAAGSRPGGAIAAAWAVLRFLGAEGYARLAGQVLETTRAFIEGIRAIPGLRVLGEPDMSVLAFTSDDPSLDIYAVGDAMEAAGWHLDRQQLPPALHIMVTPAHAPVTERFLTELRAAAGAARETGPASEGMGAMYGVMATLPDRGTVKEAVLGLLDGIYQPEA